ncbi:hypothetical protein JKF63_02988 [Porcisia hertigi]|uniref:RING-type domain-containing protein n=1 Tax=Porcisia hertigi TaxID=2761500 RepID=A0A836IMK2_9TRYP|nr:hypothetical protein JKF63_02988 [Porcisia hertigi]
MASLQASSSLALVPTSLEEVGRELQKLDGTLVGEIQEELVCVVCGAVFIDPRILECQHCFCLRCLYSTVSRNRTENIEVPCAYRCTQVTVTQGDIRTLPKNHCITNTCVVLRQHRARRARLLERKLSLMESVDKAALTPVDRARTDSIAVPLADAGASLVASAASLPQETSIATPRFLLKNEADAVNEIRECEWCSCASPTCVVCPYCWSRICAECRGQFSDHQYLCAEAHQPMRPPAVSWVRGLSTATANTEGGAATLQENGVSRTSVVGRSPGMEEAAAVPETQDQAASLPFFITPLFVPALIQECLVGEHCLTLQRSEMDVTNMTAVRLAVPEVEVQCRHHTTGFCFDFCVHPPFKTPEGVEADLSGPHWADSSAKPSATLSFLANTARLGETVLQDLRQLSTVMNKVGMELSSAAHQAYVRRNKEFHMYVVHVWSLVWTQCMIASDALLPHLERSRLLASIMGDLAVYQFQQSATHAAPPQKYAIRDTCMAFMRAEVLLCRQLGQVMEGIDAACHGIRTQLAHMYAVMKDLAQPKVHRGEEHKRARQSRQRFSAQIFQSHQVAQQNTHRPESIVSAVTPADELTPSPHTRTETVSSLSQGLPCTDKVPVKTKPLRPPLFHNTAGAAFDPFLEDNPGEASCGFRGQVAEHGAMTRTLTGSMLSILRCFMQVRVWEWSLSNTCLRECGLTEESQRTLLEAEESLQRITDNLLHNIWSYSRMMFILEVGQDAAGPASSLEILMDAETLDLLHAALECPVYSHTEVFGILERMSQLRAESVATNPATAFAARSSDAQEGLLSTMSTILKATMTHQSTLLSLVVAASTLLNKTYAAYLSVRQINPAVGERPPLSEHTLRAVDVLNILQRYSGKGLSGYGDTASNGRNHGDSVQNVYCVPQCSPRVDDSLVPQGEHLFQSYVTSALKSVALSQQSLFLADFGLRDTALSSCQVYGEALVRTAHGERLPTASVSEDQQRDQKPEEQTSDAAVARQAALELLASPRETLERSTVLEEGLTTSRALLSSVAHLQRPDSHTQSNPSPLNTETAAAPIPINQETDCPAKDGVASHRELLFEADTIESMVASAGVSPSAADSDGTRKAVKMFRAAFQLPATTASVGRQRLLLLPFYRGECVYKGRSTPFYVDGQTGAVFINPRGLSAAGRRQYVFGVLSSPFFFVVFNSALSVFLHRRYRLELFYR